MAKSLYEILEVNPKASKEAIDAAWMRLSEKFDPESAANRGRSDALLQYKAVREAHAILGNPDRRSNYDRMHPSPGVVVVRPADYAPSFADAEPFWNIKKALVLLLVVAIAGTFYLRSAHDREVEAAEHARIEAEKRQAAARLEAERQAQQQAIAEERAKRMEAAQQEADLRRFSQEVNRNERAREMAEQAAARRQEYERRMDEQRLLAQQRAETYQAKAREAELERKVRQRELEEQYRRPSVIVIPDLRQKR